MSGFLVPGTSYSPEPANGLRRSQTLCHVAFDPARVQVERLTVEFCRADGSRCHDEGPGGSRPQQANGCAERDGLKVKERRHVSPPAGGPRSSRQHDRGALRITVLQDDQAQLNGLEVRAVASPQSEQMDNY
jgi:hypothetical protein